MEKRDLISIKSWDEIPTHNTEEEEARYWSGHALEPSLMQSAIVHQDASDSTTITLRMDPRMLSRLKRLARNRYLNYQSMIKQWLSERLEKETREM